MKFDGFNINDFKNLSDIRKLNTSSYINGYYESEYTINKVKSLNKITFDKMKALMLTIKEDLTFKNFDIGICKPKKIPGKGKFGEYRHNIWIWMADKQWCKKIQSLKKNPARYRIPQIQISINDKDFISAELWFEKTSLKERKKLIDYLSKFYKGDSRLGFFAWPEDNEDLKFDRIASLKNMKSYINLLEDPLYNESSVYISYHKTFVKQNPLDLVKSVKQDLVYLIKTIYEPVFGNILSYNKKISKKSVDHSKKLEIENIGYREVRNYYKSMGYVVNDVYKDNLGWDLEAIGGKNKFLLEVKGLSSSNINIELTPNEYRNLKNNRKNYKVCIVTNCLKSPKVYIFSYRNKGKWINQYGTILNLEERIGLKMYC